MGNPDRVNGALDATLAKPASRRTVLKTGGALAGAMAMPYFFTRRAAARQGQTLSFWQFYAPGGQVSTQAQWFEDTVKAWNDQNETKVELEYTPVAEYLDGAKLQTAFASGEGPDIFIISPGDFLRYYNGGVLTDLTPYMEPEAVADFYPDVIASRAVDDKIFGLPMEVEPMAFYYSLDAWEEAGLGDGDIPQTWEQLLAVAEQLQTDERFGVLFETTPGYYQTFTWYPFMWQGGGELVGPDNKSAFNSEATIQALKFWRDAIDSGVAPREVLGGGGGNVDANLAAGYCAIQNVGIWAISGLRENNPDFRYGVFKLPLPPNGTYTTDLGGWAFVANAQGKDPETAAQFCVSSLGATSPESVQRGVDWISKAKSDVGPRTSVMDKATADGAFAEGAMKVFAEQIFPGGRGEPRVPPEIYKPVVDAIQAVQLGGTDPAQAAEEAAQQMDAFLATYEGASIF